MTLYRVRSVLMTLYRVRSVLNVFFLGDPISSTRWTAEVAAELEPEDCDDGQFWCTAEDFFKHFNNVFVAKQTMSLYSVKKYLIDTIQRQKVSY